MCEVYNLVRDSLSHDESLNSFDSFSVIHALAYSFIGMQTLFLATNFDPVYWNTAYLIVNSGALDEDAAEQTDYTKIAKAIGGIRSAGIKVSLVDINNSGFGFKPDARNGQILFGLKGLPNLNNDFIKTIIEHRPYVSIVDFMERVHPNRQVMLALIKGGAFDQFAPRQEAMVQYIWLACDKKKRLTLQNIPSLIRYDLIPHTDELMYAKSIFEFNRYLKHECKEPMEPDYYFLTERAIDFLNKINEPVFDSLLRLDVKVWDKIYKKKMDVFREWIADNKEQILDDLNTTIFMQDWEKYAKGTVSAWEMEALCFYYGPHELENMNRGKYGIADFFQLPEEPIVDKVFHKANATIPIYKLFRIAGTCIAKNKTKATVYLLTTDGVVPVKFRNEYFALFDKQVSQRQSDGTKKVVEKSWFNRGNMIVVRGIRRGEEFVTKNYKSSGRHQLYHIDEILPSGDLILRSERYNGDEEEEDG